MTVYISLLRGINVGGNKKIRMADLRQLYESLGFTGAKSILQSGNVVFESDTNDADALARQIEVGIEKTFDFHSDVIIRSADELQDIIAANPFSDMKAVDPGKLLVTFFPHEPDKQSVKTLLDTYDGPEKIHFREREMVVHYTEGVGRSKLAPAANKLKPPGTARNWRTIEKLAALAKEFEAS